MYQIGVDIGGTNIKVGLVNETMELVQTCSVRFPHDGARSVVKTIEEAVDFLLRQQAIARKDVESVGIVVPGSIDQTGERVIDAYNLGFHDVPLKALVQEAFEGVPVYLANDAKRRGAGRALRRRVPRLQDGGAAHARHGARRRHHLRRAYVQRRYEPGRGAGAHVSGQRRRALHLRQRRLHGSVLRGKRTGARRKTRDARASRKA